MKKIEILQDRQLAITEVEEQVLQDHEVMIRVGRIALCGSDIHLYEGTYGGPKHYPMIFGHEWSGEIVRTGSAVAHLDVGTKVTGDCSRYCGICENCQIDKNLCKEIEKFGITIDGASAEKIVRDARYVYPCDDAIEYSVAALTEPMAVSANLLKRMYKHVGSFSDKKVLVIGLGGIGLGALLQLRHTYGCSKVHVSDISELRKDVARNLGGTIVELDSGNGGESYDRLYQGNGYDLIIDTTGSPQVMKMIFSLANPFGTIGCLGMLPSVEIPQKLIVLKALTVLGSIGGTGSFEEMLSFIKEHQGEVKHIISHTIEIQDRTSLQDAFDIAQDPNRSVKVVLDLSALHT